MADEGDILTDLDNPNPAAGGNGADNLPTAGIWTATPKRASAMAVSWRRLNRSPNQITPNSMLKNGLR